jgi:tRNA 2-selenouridine synthase
LKKAGEQILDLEFLAKHKGSVLGRYVDKCQPKQKLFESFVWDQLRNFEPTSCVWIESESKRIGNVSVPEELFRCMVQAPRIDIQVPKQERVRSTIEDYSNWVDDPEGLKNSLALLKKVVPNSIFERWTEMIDARDWNALVGSLLMEHYDPTYCRSLAKNTRNCKMRIDFPINDLTSENLNAVIIPQLIHLQRDSCSAS